MVVGLEGYVSGMMWEWNDVGVEGCGRVWVWKDVGVEEFGIGRELSGRICEWKNVGVEIVRFLRFFL